MNHVALDSQILSSLMSCARLTDLRFNHSLIPLGGKSNSLECGSIVHVFLEYYYKALITHESRTDAIAKGLEAAQLYITGCPYCKDLPMDIAEGPCGHKTGEFVGVKNTPAESEKYTIGYNWVLDTCNQYAEHYRADSWVPLEAESVRKELVYEDSEIKIIWKAKFDLIVDTNQGIIPVDHKTMKQRRDSLSLNNQFMGQCILTKSRNMIVDKIGFQTSLKPNEKFERAMMSYSADRLYEWQNEILPFYAKLLVAYSEEGYFPPNFTHCENKYGFCQYKDVCESDRGMREEVLRKDFIVGRKWEI